MLFFQNILKFYQPFRSHSNATPPSLAAFPDPFQEEGNFLLLNAYSNLWLFIYAVPLSLSCILVRRAQILFPLLDRSFLTSRKYPALHVTCQKKKNQNKNQRIYGMTV